MTDLQCYVCEKSQDQLDIYPYECVDVLLHRQKYHPSDPGLTAKLRPVVWPRFELVVKTQDGSAPNSILVPLCTSCYFSIMQQSIDNRYHTQPRPLVLF